MQTPWGELVYLVEHGEYEQTHISGVYSSYEKAQECKGRVQAEFIDHPHLRIITEIEVYCDGAVERWRQFETLDDWKIAIPLKDFVDNRAIFQFDDPIHQECLESAKNIAIDIQREGLWNSRIKAGALLWFGKALAKKERETERIVFADYKEK